MNRPFHNVKRPVRPVLRPYRQGRERAMKKTAWIWFAGLAAWVVDALINLRLHNWLHARLALMVALVFLTAGLFYRNQT